MVAHLPEVRIKTLNFAVHNFEPGYLAIAAIDPRLGSGRKRGKIGGSLSVSRWAYISAKGCTQILLQMEKEYKRRRFGAVTDGIVVTSVTARTVVSVMGAEHVLLNLALFRLAIGTPVVEPEEMYRVVKLLATGCAATLSRLR